ncbi:M14-type cytosolic carboxypeptidase [Myxococcota bacterium]|nr:M14-type cytosolic carboxypeptidase [Myxococcota bacterium]
MSRRVRLFMWWMLMASSVPAVSKASLEIDANFDSGRIGAYTIDETLGEIEFSLDADGTNYVYWFNFKLLGAAGREIVLRITNASEVAFLSDDDHESQIVYSEDGETWQRLTDASYYAGTYIVTQTFESDEVQIATFFPYSTARASALVDSAAASPWATKTVLGASYQGRDIDLLTITNPEIQIEEKKAVFIVARQHAAEVSSSHMVGGLIGFLVSDDAYAAGFRDGYIWHIVPMLNPDGVYVGNSRSNSEGNDPNRDWHPNNHDSPEVDLARDYMDAVRGSTGVDLFLDWHSQMKDDRWYNFVYAPPENGFFEILSDWTDFDSQSISSSSCRVSSCTAYGYARSQAVLGFTIEPTPHLVTWTEESLRTEGVNTAFAINENFGQFAGPLLTDSNFSSSTNSTSLIADGVGFDWYESRADVPSLVSLDRTTVGLNGTPKAKFTGSTQSNAYLSQKFGAAQTGVFGVQWDIRVEEILDVEGTQTDRAGWMLIGDNSSSGQSGPNATDSERFVYMAFFREGGGVSGDTMDLVARDRDDGWSDFTTVATGLEIGEWIRIRVVCNVSEGTYEVYVNGQYEATLASRHAKSSLSHISFAQWEDGAGTFFVDNVIDSAIQSVPAVRWFHLVVLALSLTGVASARLRARWLLSSGQGVRVP